MSEVLYRVVRRPVSTNAEWETVASFYRRSHAEAEVTRLEAKDDGSFDYRVEEVEA